MKTAVRYSIVIVVSATVLYNSLYFMPLDERLAENGAAAFDAESFVDGIWGQDLRVVYDSAIEITGLLRQLKESPAAAFDQHAQSIGIGNIGYFRVKGEGKVLHVNENNVLVEVTTHQVILETEFIFGNAIRDASGLVRINDYNETSDFNRISESINDRVRKEIIPPFKAQVKEGNMVQFRGAMELNKAHLDFNRLSVIPVSIHIIR